MGDIHYRQDWLSLEAMFREEATAAIDRTIGRTATHYQEAVAFAIGRLIEGRQVGEFFAIRLGRPLCILDVGAGNGGVSSGAANISGHKLHALDLVPNSTLRSLTVRTRLPIRQVIGGGHAIPYQDNTFDVVFCLETLEHVLDTSALGAEIIRVLRPGGICMLTTPARLKYLFRADPHFGIHGLLLLPDFLQRFVAVNVLRRVPSALYDVVHIFWTLRGVTEIFPGHNEIEPLFNNPEPPGTLWFHFRNLLWDRILITKGGLSE